MARELHIEMKLSVVFGRRLSSSKTIVSGEAPATDTLKKANIPVYRHAVASGRLINNCSAGNELYGSVCCDVVWVEGT